MNVAVPPASVVVRPVVGVTVMPAASLSVLVTVTSAGVDAVVGRVRARRRRRDDRVGDVAVVQASSTPVTVTVCATFQFAVVNVRLAGETVPSVVSLELSPIVTSAVGCD